MADIFSGMREALDSGQRRKESDARMQALIESLSQARSEFQQQQQDRERKTKARATAADLLEGLAAFQDKPPGAQAPPPGTPSVPMLPPQGAAPPAPQGPPPMMGGKPPPMPMATQPFGAPPTGAMPPMGMPKPDSWKPPPGMPAAAGMPPGAMSPKPPEEGAILPRHKLDLLDFARDLKKRGVVGEEAFEVLELLRPVADSENKKSLDTLKEEREVLQAKAAVEREMRERFKAQKEAREGGKPTTDIQNIEYGFGKDTPESHAAMRAEIKRKARMGGEDSGGFGALKNEEYIYPKKPDGTPDETKGPIGLRGVTKSGKIIVLDADGHQTTLSALAGMTEKEGKSTKIGVTNVVRQNIVKAGVKNSLDRLNEIEKKYGDKATTSSFFGQSAEGPVTRAAYGAGRSLQSAEQQKIDAAWASFIDEAIPVFTGGLRGSDAFRRFLIEQAPGPGDKPEAVREKRRLIRANIEGTSKAFFNKFASDQSMWAPGTKPEEVDEAKGGTQGGGDWKVEKVK